ncbi:XrtA/PEP-CTERM system TPR-repeat protein PrsT [Pseudorhodoferax sp.]|uniref:XrtA/PEP-CTERM system TPR-repeat protein PrsT n=1 Tax=Pseudorhodoferax sp. TaxID=1993553 RepID=UPI002DD699E2|nr:XrtA/PEP-CTERM system TPR-repeat protein PrsT [Pseudorhodoferax sp.]
MQRKNFSITFMAVAAATALLLAGCGDNPQSLLSSAKEYMAKNDHKAAAIQIKNVLQKQPNSAEARFLLGASLLATGDAAAAEIELRKARELKYPDDEVVPRLARAMLLQEQTKKLVEELGAVQLSTPPAVASLQASLAAAYTAERNPTAAQQALSKALAAEPQNTTALLLQARAKLAARDVDGALAGVDALLQREAKNGDAWRFKADVLRFVKNQPDEALAAYRKAIEVQPNDIRGYFGTVGMLTRQGKLDDAEKDMAALRKIAPKHPEVLYLDTQLSYAKRDFVKARQQAQDLLRAAPFNPRALEIAGGIDLQRNALVTAEEYLSKALQADPNLPMARRWLVAAYLRTGQSGKAQTTIAPLINDKTADAALLALAGEVQLLNGDPKRAEEYFARASKLDPTDGRKRTVLAMTQMAGGRFDAGIEQLQDIASSDKGTSADMALISTHMRRQEYDKALKAIDALEKKTPNVPSTAQLRGRVLMAKNDPNGARKSFEAGLAANPNYFPLVASLAGLDIVERKPEQARKRFEDLLSRDPKNARAMVALAEMKTREPGDQRKPVTDLLTRAIAAEPTEAAPRVLLIDFLIQQKDPKQAVTIGQAGVAALPDNAMMLDAAGRAQLAAGDVNQATTTLARAAVLQPQAPAPLLRLADAQQIAKNPAAAEESLRKALELQPNLLDAQRRLIGLRLEQNRLQDAVTLARAVQKQRPKEHIGYMLEGEARLSKKDMDGAITAFQTGLKAAPAPELMVRLLATLRMAGKGADADRQASGWQQSNPKDVIVPLYLADLAMGDKRMADAEKIYLNVVKQQPNNAVAYNNLAWVASELKRDNALSYAEKANELAPNQAAFIDTWAMLLADKQDYKKAIELQSKAVGLQADNLLFKLNMAKIYAKAGQKGEAKQLLDDLAKQGDKFAGQAEVEKLRATL